GGESFSPGELMANNFYVTRTDTKADMTVPLGNLVTWSVGASPTVIVRENRERTIRVGGGLARGAALGDIVETLEAKLAELPLPTGYHVRVVGQNEQMNEFAMNVVSAIGLGLIFV